MPNAERVTEAPPRNSTDFAQRTAALSSHCAGRIDTIVREAPMCGARKPVVVPNAQYCVVLERLGYKVTVEKAA